MILRLGCGERKHLLNADGSAGIGGRENDLDTLFDLPIYWDAPNWVAKPIGRQTADDWCKQYHYHGSAGTALWRYGIFPEDSDMVCVVVFSLAANASGVAVKLGLDADTGNVELSRVATHPDAPKMTTTRCVALALKQFHADTGIEWVFSYADSGHGHHGGIYQALNAFYVGMTPSSKGYLLDGKPVHPRGIVSLFGSRSADNIAVLQRQGVNIEVVDGLNAAKHLYVLPCGGPSVRRRVHRVLQPKLKPYPKKVFVDS